MNEWAQGVRRVAVLTGAGISTDSGIPDYRGPDGVWTKDPGAADAFTYQNFKADANARKRLWASYADHAAWRAEPNVAHQALAELAKTELAVRILTQNVDGLHQRAGLASRKVLELHGTMRQTECVGCHVRTPTEEVLARGEADPACPDCGGILKPAVVLFGQYLDSDLLGRARSIAAASQLFLAVGSSLQVEPVASLCELAVHSGAKLVIVNRDPTPYDDLAVAVLREPIGEAVPQICTALSTAGDTQRQ